MRGGRAGGAVAEGRGGGWMGGRGAQGEALLKEEEEEDEEGEGDE